ncbi:hypothetical protein NE865_00513 [Phthorimaea operculella]|nr:hypothetical protein NE865_00513 [Phthorimaea operculella]
MFMATNLLPSSDYFQLKNTTLRSKTRITDVGKKAARLKWDWAGHVCRMHTERWAKIATDFIPEERRRRGRPRKRWRDDLVDYDPNWSETAADRKAWKERGEAFAQQWDTVG